MSATDELRRMLDEFERDLCHAGCGVECGTYVERKELLDGVKDRYAQTIAATLGGGTLTAEQVREAIFGNSSYASYDGAKYYADGIGMQAVADELNTRAERTCRNVAPNPGCFECFVCGCDVSGGDELGANMFNGGWNYCPNCGAKVVSE